jgi:hypothetical protein
MNGKSVLMGAVHSNVTDSGDYHAAATPNTAAAKRG